MTPQMTHADINQTDEPSSMAGMVKPAVNNLFRSEINIMEEIKQSNQNYQTLYHDMSPFNGSIP
jgi:hypothetical protein